MYLSERAHQISHFRNTSGDGQGHRRAICHVSWRQRQIHEPAARFRRADNVRRGTHGEHRHACTRARVDESKTFSLLGREQDICFTWTRARHLLYSDESKTFTLGGREQDIYFTWTRASKTFTLGHCARIVGGCQLGAKLQFRVLPILPAESRASHPRPAPASIPQSDRRGGAQIRNCARRAMSTQSALLESIFALSALLALASIQHPSHIDPGRKASGPRSVRVHERASRWRRTANICALCRHNAGGTWPAAPVQIFAPRVIDRQEHSVCPEADGAICTQLPVLVRPVVHRALGIAEDGLPAPSLFLEAGPWRLHPLRGQHQRVPFAAHRDQPITLVLPHLPGRDPTALAGPVSEGLFAQPDARVPAERVCARLCLPLARRSYVHEEPGLAVHDRHKVA
jgi:hypothetical protein